MTLKKSLMLLALLALAPLVLGVPTALGAQGEPYVYVVKKGDTLWGISERFVKDPFYWPSLWSNNPEVTNPHFIYPGQKLAIYDGRIEILPAETVLEQTEEPAVELETTLEPAREPAPVLFRVPRSGAGFIALRELESLGTLVDTTDNRIMMGAGSTIFIDMQDLAATEPDQVYGMYKVGKAVTHPVTGAPFGRRISDLGLVRIVDVHDEVATGVITDAFQEVERGARLREARPARTEIALKRAEEVVEGFVVAARYEQIALGQNDFIYLDRGSEDGLEVGNMLYVSRPRQASELGLQGREVKLPDILLGAALVVDVQPDTATALVVKSADAILRGDRVTTMVE